MKKQWSSWKERLWKEEWGATAVEYGLLVAGIAIAIAAVVFLFGGRLRGVFQRLAGMF